MNGDFLLFTRALILGGDVEDTIRIDIEGDFDLRGATWRRSNAIETEGAEVLVVLGHLALALEHDDFDGRLVVRVGRKDLRLLGRAVFVVDREGLIRYQQVVPELTHEPDYEPVLKTTKELL